MRERDFQRRITDMADRFGWKWWHVPAPMRSSRNPSGAHAWVPAREAAGLPDLILLCEDPERMILAEVKGDGGKLSSEQQEFLRLARNVANVAISDGDKVWYSTGHTGRTVGVYAWFPPDEPTIETILRTKVLL